MNIGLGYVGCALLSVLIALPVGWLVGALGRRLRIARAQAYWRRQSTIYAEYEAPENLRPGEIAFLYDRSFGRPELLATLFDLELRKKIILTPLPARNGSVDFSIQVPGTVVADDLGGFEQEVLATLKSYSPKATWNLLRIDTAVWDSGIERQLEADLQQKGYFRERTDKFRSFTSFGAMGILFAGLFVALPTAWSQNWWHHEASGAAQFDTYASLRHETDAMAVGLVWLIAAAALGFAFYLALSAYRRAMDMERGTAHLAAVWPHIEGFRQYLEVVEQDRIQFENQTLQARARQAALPYAVALELPTKWQARFLVR